MMPFQRIKNMFQISADALPENPLPLPLPPLLPLPMGGLPPNSK